MPIDVGQLLRGYEIRQFIQQGGFGTVYRAFQDSINRNVAIKVIDNLQVVNHIDFIRRFEVEAQIIARLEHPHIVPMYDFWREPDSAFIVMRWLDGGSMRDKMVQQGHTLTTLNKLVQQIGLALHFVHQQNVIHRDIKPDNILVDAANNFYLSDFGIAVESQNIASEDAESLRIGTPEYMPPELILDDAITYKSDIYALAISVFEILTGHPPFTGDNIDAILIQQVNVTFPSIHRYRQDLPLNLDKVLQKASAKSPDDRYESVLEFVQEFTEVIADVNPTTRLGASFPRSESQIVNTVTFSDNVPSQTVAFGDNVPSQTISFGDNVPSQTISFGDASVKIRNPYKGLQAFDEFDTHDFYGRKATIQQMLSLLEHQHDNGQSQFIAVVGASGSGKSSLVRAGLFPQLRAGAFEDSADGLYITMLPNDTPIQTLAEKLNSIATQGQSDLAHILSQDIDIAVTTILDMFDETPIVLLIDQFEEIFTQVTDEAQQAQFINLIVKLIQSRLPLTIIITLRADFYAKPLAYRELGELIQNGTVTVLPMSPDELEQVIVAPAQSVGCKVQASLVSQLIADTIHQPNALPLLQFTITELFEKRENDELTHEAYETMGRIQGAIAQRAEHVYSSLRHSQQDMSQRLFLQLITLSEDNKAVRRRILWKDSLQIAKREDIEAIINVFGDNRLLTFDRDPISRQPTIEVAHEALLQAWTRLQIWIYENQNILNLYHRLALSVRDWTDNQQDDSFLARDNELFQYEGVASSPLIIMTAIEKDFIESSQNLQRKNKRLRYMAIASLIFLTVASVIVSILAVEQRNQATQAQQLAVVERDRANTEASRSQSQALAATALNSRETGQSALGLAVQAMTIADTFEARDSLATILADHQFVTQYLTQPVMIRDIALSTDGSQLYIIGDSPQVLQMSINDKTSNVLIELDNLTVINTLEANSENTLLALGSDAGITLIDIASKSILKEIQRNTEVWSVVWSANNEIIYAVDRLGSVLAYDVLMDTLLYDIVISEQPLLTIALHPDDNLLMVGGEDNTIIGIDAETGEILYEFGGHSNWVLSLDFSPDGQLLASAGADLSVIVWDMVNLQAIGQIPTGHGDWIRQVQFSPDGERLLTASADGILQEWDVAQGRRVGIPLIRHNAPIWSATYINNSQIVSADRDGQLIHWTLDALQFPLINIDDLSTEIVTGVVTNPQRAMFVTQDNEEAGFLQSLDLSTGDIQEIMPLNSFVTRIVYSSASNRIALAGLDQQIVLINLADNSSEVLSGHDSIILDIAFSPDGKTLLSIDEQGSLIRWDTTTINETDQKNSVTWENISKITFIDNTQLLVIWRDGQMGLYSADSLSQIQVIEAGHDGAVTGFVLSDDTQTLYTIGRDGMLIEWDTQTWDMQADFPQVHTDWILDIIQLNDEILVTTGRDGTLVIWDINRSQPIGQALALPSDAWGVGLLQDDSLQRVYSLSRDGMIGLWDINFDNWIRYTCDVANLSSCSPNSK